MSLKIVTGGTTGAADGTIVDSGNPLVFTAIDTPIDAHIRADDGTYGSSVVFQMATTAGPAVGKGDLQVSLDGGSSWHGWSENPIAYGSDLGDLNVAIKLRQHAASPPGDTSGSFDTDGTFRLANVAGLTGTRSSSGTSVDLSWTAVPNRTYYKIERATAADFSTGLTTLTATLTATTYSDTGRTAGTTYYYRIKALGTGAYSDSPGYATLAAYPQGYTAFALTSTSGAPINSVEGPDGNMWVVLNDANKIARITPDGATRDEFACPSGVTNPQDICLLGSNLWYTGSTSGHIVKISTFSGTPTQTAYSITAAYGICALGGYLYVTSDSTTVRKVDPATGAVVSSGFGTSGVVTVASGNLRFIVTDGTDLYITNYGYPTTGAIVKCTTSGTTTTTACPDSGALPLGLSYDAASSCVYIAGLGSGKIYKVTVGATQTWTGYTINASAQPASTCVGIDGRIYTAGYNSSFKNIYSMASGGGSFTTEAAIGAGAGAWGLAKHSNDAIWVCENISGAAKFSRYVK